MQGNIFVEPDVFGLWKETWAPGGNSQRREGHLQTKWQTQQTHRIQPVGASCWQTMKNKEERDKTQDVEEDHDDWRKGSLRPKLVSVIEKKTGI